jgi:hypothetical protein
MSNAYYSASAGAKLYIGTSVAAVLPAFGSDTFTEVPLTGTISPPKHEISAGFFSVLNDIVKRSVGGKKADQSCDGNLVIDWTEAVHLSMYADMQVAGGQKRNWRIIYPDSGNRQLDFKAFLSKWDEEQFDAGQDAKEHRASFTLTIDGAITATP